MPGVTDQDLRWSEAYLGDRRRLAGVIKAVFAGPPPQAHRRGRGWEEHFAKPRCGTWESMLHEGSIVCAVVMGGSCGWGGGVSRYNI
jgi:hypothetical protein